MGVLLFDAADPDGVVGREDGLLEFIVDPALFPTKFLEVLGPLEVGYDYPAGIDQDISGRIVTPPWLRTRSASGVMGWLAASKIRCALMS